MSGRLIPWGHSGNQPSAYGATKYEHADSIDLPSGSILSTADTPFKRGKFFQACIDIFALTFLAFFICASAASLPLAIFIMFFVDTKF